MFCFSLKKTDSFSHEANTEKVILNEDKTFSSEFSVDLTRQYFTWNEARGKTMGNGGHI